MEGGLESLEKLVEATLNPAKTQRSSNNAHDQTTVVSTK